MDLKALDNKLATEPKFRDEFKETLTQKSETIKIDKAQEKEIKAANKETSKEAKPLIDERRTIKPENIQKVAKHTVMDSVMNKKNKSFGQDIMKISEKLKSEMTPVGKESTSKATPRVPTQAQSAHR